MKVDKPEPRHNPKPEVKQEPPVKVEQPEIKPPKESKI